MELLPKALREQLPPLYTQEAVAEEIGRPAVIRPSLKEFESLLAQLTATN